MSTSEAAEPVQVRRDFRSSYYYKSLHGFKGGEKSLGHLEVLLSMDVLGKQLPALYISVYCPKAIHDMIVQIWRS